MFAVIIEGPDGENEEVLEQWFDTVDSWTENLDDATNGRYATGQDDGQNFFACANEQSLKNVFPNQKIIKIDMDEYPWDYNGLEEDE